VNTNQGSGSGGGQRPRRRLVGSLLRLSAIAFIMLALTFSFLAVYQRVFSPFEAVTNNSMSPQIKSGDAVMVKEVDAADVKVGQVIIFRNPQNREELIVHRVVAVEVAGPARYFTTKGDSNPANDEGRITGGQIVGAMSRSLPRLGALLNFLFTMRGFVACICAPAALSLLLVFLLGLAEFASKLRDRRRGLQTSP